MKKALCLLVLFCSLTTVANAGLKVTGKGDSMRIDPTRFAPAMKANYDIMMAKCLKCHTLERTIVAIQTGVAPISGAIFDRNATKAYGIKMLRKPDSNMSKAEVKATVDLMNYLLIEAEQK